MSDLSSLHVAMFENETDHCPRNLVQWPCMFEIQRD